VLFADIRGFTPLSEKARPEEVVRLLNTYFQAMTDTIFAYGGTLDKYIGDGLMALFGAPYSGDEDAANAVRAAIAMQSRMVGLVEELKQLDLPEIGIGIGINTGEVTVGYIGSTQRLDYTAIGDTVNLAARLESKATRWQILISESTKHVVGDMFSTSPMGPVSVKGRATSVEVYEVPWRPVDWRRTTLPIDGKS
jgi:adenylate cyclase